MISAISIKTDLYVSPKYANKYEQYKCPECNKEVIICKGDIIKPYFRHKSDIQPCKYYDKTSESQIHKDAKELLRYWLQNGYSLSITRTCVDCNETECFEIPEMGTNSKIYVEYRFEYNGLKIADVCYLDEGDIVCIFEVYHTHKTESIKWPGMWFELNAETLINYDGKTKNINLTCVRTEKCEECIEKENEKNKKRKDAANILYTWLQSRRIKPFDYFQIDRTYCKTNILEDDYFNIGIYEMWEDDNESCMRYKIRLCFEDENPDFQGHENDDIELGTIGIYFVDVDWIYSQTIQPGYIRYKCSLDYYINGYDRCCTNRRCNSDRSCCYNLPFRVKHTLDVFDITSVDNWCDIKKGSDEIPCVLCKDYCSMNMMYTNINMLYCRNCDVECYSNKRIYFDVPFSEKDRFKEFGGYWDANKKKWYCDLDNENMTEMKNVWKCV